MAEVIAEVELDTALEGVIKPSELPNPGRAELDVAVGGYVAQRLRPGINEAGRLLVEMQDGKLVDSSYIICTDIKGEANE